MTDWVMVVLTAIYVLATILICYYNYGPPRLQEIKLLRCAVNMKKIIVHI